MHATGSNNWVVSGERSVTGRPLLACDPHLTTTIPDLWYEADLACDDYRVRGATLPTNPFPVFGQTAFAAWGFTNVMADTQDLFVERLNPDDARMYEFEGDWRQAEVVREEIQVKGRGTPEALDVTITHHGPIVSEALGASEPIALSWTGLQYPLLTDSGHRLSTARGGQDIIEAAESPPRSSAQPAVGRPRRQHRLPARGQDPAAQGQRARPAQAGLDRRVRVGRERSPTRTCPRLVNPRAGLHRDREQPHRRRRLPAPHHLRVDDRLPRAAHRGAPRRARAPFARRLRAHAARLLLVPGRRDGAPALTPASRASSARSARSSGSRAGTATSTPTRSRGRSSTRSRSCSRRRSCGRRSTDDELVERWLNKSGVALFEVVSSPWRFQERLLDAVGRGRPGLVRPGRAVGRGRARGAREGARRPRGALRPRPGEWRWGRVHGVEFAHPFGSANPLFRRIFNRKVRGRRGERDRHAERLPADRAVQGRLGPGLPDARRPRRPAPLALAAHDRPVRPSRLAALRRHDRGLARRQHEPRVPRGARGPRGRRRASACASTPTDGRASATRSS